MALNNQNGQVRRFLGMVNFYRRSLPHAAEAQAPLNQLHCDSCKNGKREIPWDTKNEAPWDRVQRNSANATVLVHPSHDVETRFVTNASAFDMRASPIISHSFLRSHSARRRQLNANRGKSPTQVLTADPKCSLKFRKLQWGPEHTTVYCDLNGKSLNPYIPLSFRGRVFRLFHDLVHPSAKGTDHVIRKRYVWPTMSRNIKSWNLQSQIVASNMYIWT